MDTDSKIYVAGHAGLVGSALVRRLKKNGCTNLITRTSRKLNHLDQTAVSEFFNEQQPEYVFQATAKVGGILANDTFPAQFIYQNLQIQNNIIHSSHLNGVKKLLFLGSSCAYPKFPDLPIRENSLLTGTLEPTNESYAIAKRAGIKMCQAYSKEYGCNFISAMPTNIYGLNDNYHPQNSHVLAALIKKIVDAKMSNTPKIELWGTGEPKREFLHADDLADACLFLMLTYDSPEIINVGTSKEISLLELTRKIQKIANYECEIIHDYSKPDGVMSKVLDVSKLNSLGWRPKISLDEGIKMNINDYIKNYH